MNRTYFSRYEPPVPQKCGPAKPDKPSGILGNLFSGMAIDDLILIAVIIILVTDEKPDMITVLALVYIFLV